jgi:hypothetical protein
MTDLAFSRADHATRAVRILLMNRRANRPASGQRPYKFRSLRGCVSGFSEVRTAIRGVRMAHLRRRCHPRGFVKAVLAVSLILPLLGCTSYPAPGSSVHVPSPSELKTGDCNTLAQEHRYESAWQETNASDQQRVFETMLTDCQQWKAANTWKDAAQ